ncbi:hypothetical protein GVX86_05465 [[Haemophilus] felis]|nr:hypothetical protein [[Haemophilus] felis]
MRFDIFLKAEKALEEMDYLFFFNANMKIVDYIYPQEFFNVSKPLVAVKHPGFVGVDKEKFTYDKNPDSLAYMEDGKGNYYFMGGLNGGEKNHYLRLIHQLKENIQQDLEKNIIALWHDESHINKYFFEHEPELLILSEIYGTPEEDIANSFFKSLFVERKAKERGVKILIRNKSHVRYGGHNWLRGLSKRQSLKQCLLRGVWYLLKRGLSKF